MCRGIFCCPFKCSAFVVYWRFILFNNRPENLKMIIEQKRFQFSRWYWLFADLKEACWFAVSTLKLQRGGTISTQLVIFLWRMNSASENSLRTRFEWGRLLRGGGAQWSIYHHFGLYLHSRVSTLRKGHRVKCRFRGFIFKWKIAL
jgi:hypothetical protein